MSLRIALLDDNADKRATVINGLSAALKDSGWECIECPLNEDKTAYTQWLIKNRVAVLLVDQLLNEKPDGNEPVVDYKGHEVIEEIRSRLPYFPIVVVTMASEDPDLSQHSGSADHIIDRKSLLRNTEEHVPRLVRLGQNYVDIHQKELAELTDLSTKVASGQGTAEDYTRLSALQQKFLMPFSEGTDADHQLDELEDELAKLSALSKRIEEYMNGDRA